MTKKILLGSGLIALIVVMMGAAIYRNMHIPEQTFSCAVAATGSINEEVFAPGGLELRDKQEVYPPFTGKIKTVCVKVGDQVEAGQILIEMDATDLNNQIEAARLDVTKAQNDLAQERIKQDYEVADTQQVMAEAKKAMDAAQQIMDEAKMTYDNLGTEDQADAALWQASKSNYESAKLNYEKARQNYERILENPDAVSQVALATLEIRVRQAELSLKQLLSQVSRTVLKASGAGTVVAVNAEVGATAVEVGNGSGTLAGSLITIGDLGKLQAKIKVNEIDSLKLIVGQKVIITGDAFDREYVGKVDSIALIVVTSTGIRGEETTLDVMVSIDDSAGLKPGLNIDATIIVTEKPETLLIPATALTERNGKQVVFVAENGEAKEREVIIGLSGDTQQEIDAGIEIGDLVILNPGTDLKDGDRVRINE